MRETFAMIDAKVMSLGWGGSCRGWMAGRTLVRYIPADKTGDKSSAISKMMHLLGADSLDEVEVTIKRVIVDLGAGDTMRMLQIQAKLTKPLTDGVKEVLKIIWGKHPPKIEDFFKNRIVSYD